MENLFFDMGFYILKVHFTKRIHNPTKNYELGIPRILLTLVNYYLISTISREQFYNLGFDIPKQSVICVPPNTIIYKDDYEKAFRENIKKTVEEELRRELIYYGMV